jgi:hypothetical protein
MTAAEFPDACFNATIGNSATQKARTGATAGRIVSRIAIMLRIVRTFVKIFAARKYFIYLQRTNLGELCAASSIEDVKWRLRAYPGEVEKPDGAGLYPIHIAASNEHEDAPEMVEAILRTNRFSARQRSRDSQSLALHFACRNVGPTRRQDTALRLHTSMQPVCNRMVRALLDKNFGYPQGASRADVDGECAPRPRRECKIMVHISIGGRRRGREMQGSENEIELVRERWTELICGRAGSFPRAARLYSTV